MSSDESRPIRPQTAPAGRDSQPAHDDPDDSLGAVEGETPSDPQEGNPNGPGVDDEGRPDDPVATGEDRIGANLDETEG
jgi:hypothetical protein